MCVTQERGLKMVGGGYRPPLWSQVLLWCFLLTDVGPLQHLCMSHVWMRLLCNLSLFFSLNRGNDICDHRTAMICDPLFAWCTSNHQGELYCDVMSCHGMIDNDQWFDSMFWRWYDSVGIIYILEWCVWHGIWVRSKISICLVSVFCFSLMFGWVIN